MVGSGTQASLQHHMAGDMEGSNNELASCKSVDSSLVHIGLNNPPHKPIASLRNGLEPLTVTTPPLTVYLTPLLHSIIILETSPAELDTTSILNQPLQSQIQHTSSNLAYIPQGIQ